jgi:hypothetical protein
LGAGVISSALETVVEQYTVKIRVTTTMREILGQFIDTPWLTGDNRKAGRAWG